MKNIKKNLSKNLQKPLKTALKMGNEGKKGCNHEWQWVPAVFWIDGWWLCKKCKKIEEAE